MGRLVDAILNLSGPAAYGLVGLLAFGEAAAFVGLVLPGELAVLLGGVVVSSGNASLPVMIVVASVAAIAVDSAGYEVGRHVGPRILAWPPFHRHFAGKVAHATDYLADKGGRPVFVGRWTSLLRALIPGIAGMARMPYGRFLVFNVAGGVAWTTTFVMLGYLAGASWRRVERIAGRASLILLVLVVLAVVQRWATRHLLARTDQVRARLDDVAAVAAIATRHLPTAIRVAGASVGILLLAATAELVAGDATLSGIVGAVGIGGLLGAGGELTTRSLAPRTPTGDPPAVPA